MRCLAIVTDVTEDSRLASIAAAAGTSPAELFNLVARLAREAGDLVSQRRKEGVQVAATKSSIADVVTAADRESEDFLRARIAELRPDDGFFGEESDASESRSGLTWVVDPIDGTVNYLYGSPNYAVSVAVVSGDPAAEPADFVTLAGAVYSPDTGEMYVAMAGGGAYLNGRKLQIGEGPSALDTTLLATGYAYEADIRRAQAEIWLGLSDVVRDIRRVGAASLDLCALATGRIDAYFEFGLKPWDWAAGALVAREAGANVSGRSPQDAEGRGLLVATHPNITSDLYERLEKVTPAILR